MCENGTLIELNTKELRVLEVLTFILAGFEPERQTHF